MKDHKHTSEHLKLGGARRWALAFGLFTALLTSLPYLAAFANGGDGWVFSGFLFAVDDGNSYIAKMLSGTTGAWLFRTPYTAMQQEGILAYAPYIILGKLAAPPELHLQLVVIYHLFRVFAILVCVVATYEFIARIVPVEGYRRIGTLLAVFGGGLGWVPVVLGDGSWLGSLPLDFFSPETFGFLAFLGVPHLLMGRAFLFWGLLAHLDGKGWSAGLLLLAGSFFNPLVIPVAGVVLGAHLALSFILRLKSAGPDFASAIRTGMVLSPMVVYVVWKTISDPFLRAWSAQNTIFSPHPLHYLLAYGVLLFWVIMGIRKAFQQKYREQVLVAGWAIMLPVLAYAPYQLQRRLPEGVFVALLSLAFSWLSIRGEVALRRLGPLLLMFPSSVLLLAGVWSFANQPDRPVFFPENYVEAFSHLVETAPPDAVVLSSKDTGNALPAYVPLRVVIGHGPETVGFAELESQVEAFYNGAMGKIERDRFLADQGVDYIVLGPLEDRPGGWQGENAQGWVMVYERAGVRIFSLSP